VTCFALKVFRGTGDTLCSGSEAGSYLRLIDFLYHSTLGLKVMKKKKKTWARRGSDLPLPLSLDRKPPPPPPRLSLSLSLSLSLYEVLQVMSLRVVKEVKFLLKVRRPGRGGGVTCFRMFDIRLHQPERERERERERESERASVCVSVCVSPARRGGDLPLPHLPHQAARV